VETVTTISADTKPTALERINFAIYWTRRMQTNMAEFSKALNEGDIDAADLFLSAAEECERALTHNVEEAIAIIENAEAKQ